MSEKPVVNAQECDPSTLGLARKPRPAMKKKPETEIVVQLGPFTDGQITAPEMVRPLEGPTEWLIKPKSGEIVPFESGTPPEKDVIRKYITVGAQDTDVPEDLPKISDGYVIERVKEDALPSDDSTVRENGKDTVRVVEKEGPASVECETPPTTPPVDESEEPEAPPHECPPCEEPPTCPPPVDEEEECPPPVTPPVDEEEECPPPTDPEDCEPPVTPPVDEEEECPPPTDPEDCEPPVTPPVDEEEECPPPTDPEDCEPPVTPPVDEEEECPPPTDPEDCEPPVTPPVNEEEECPPPTDPEDCEPPVTPPVDEEEECPPVTPEEPECETPVEEEEECTPCDDYVDAKDDCASTEPGCSVTIDVLKNDLGCGELEITEACAENGTVEIKDGKLHYTPNEGFCGEDVISYSIGNDGCMTDSAYVYMTVGDGRGSSSDDCGKDTSDYCESDSGGKGDGKMHDYEYSSSAFDELQFDISERFEQILEDKMSSIESLVQGKSSWASNYSASSFDVSASAHAEEPVAVC